jgi:Tfp pilus assembly protein PilF
MGRVAEKKGDFDQAMAAYRAALSRDGRRADAYRRLAVIHDQQGKFRESAELYSKALALRPGDADIFCDMGYSLYLQRRWAESESNLRQAIAVDPDHARAHNNLALLLVRNNHNEDALVEFRKAANSPAQAHMNLAFALTMDERWESARAEYERALTLDPSSQAASARLNQLNALLAKRELPPDRTPNDARAQTSTATAAPSQPMPRAAEPMRPAAAEYIRPPAPRDPRLLTASAARPPLRPSLRVGARAATLPANDDPPSRLWSLNANGHAELAPRRREPVAATPLLRTHAANTARTSSPRKAASVSSPQLAVDTHAPAPASSKDPQRAPMPKPESGQLPLTKGKSASERASAPSLPSPRTFTSPPAAPGAPAAVSEDQYRAPLPSTAPRTRSDASPARPAQAIELFPPQTIP